MASIDKRLSALREYLETLSGSETTFIRSIRPARTFLTTSGSMAHTPQTGGGSSCILTRWRGWTL